MANFIHLDNRTAFQPVGRCIYCGTTDCLEEEHIVPFSIGGNFVLPEASCRPCAKVINEEIENPLLRKMLLPFRTQFGARTRDPANRPREFVVTVKAADQSERRAPVPAADACAYVFGLNLRDPGILAGRPPDPNERGELVLQLHNPARTLDAVQPKRDEQVLVADFCHTVLLRFLAKVAHGFAVAEYGIDGFDHLLPSCILNRNVPNKPELSVPGYLIGGDRRPVEPTVDAWFLIERYTCTVHATQQHYAAVWFKLFAMVPGMPHYVIVAGPLRR